MIDFTIIPYVHIYCRLNRRCFSSELLNNTISYRRRKNLHKSPLTETKPCSSHFTHPYRSASVHRDDTVTGPFELTPRLGTTAATREMMCVRR